MQGFDLAGTGEWDATLARKEGRWRRREGWVWKEGRGVKWAGIGQALRTRDRDVSRERDKKALSRAGSVGWASVTHDLLPRRCRRGVSLSHTRIVNTSARQNGFHRCTELRPPLEIAVNYSAQSADPSSTTLDREPMVLPTIVLSRTSPTTIST